MRFSIRDVMWATATTALVAALFINSQRNVSHSRILEQRAAAAEDQVALREQMIEEHRVATRQIVEGYRKKKQDQYEEILTLRQLLKQSIDDQRDWFELEVSRNRIIAIRPATPDSPNVTLQTVYDVEAITGLDGKRLKHLMTPIPQLRPKTKELHVPD